MISILRSKRVREELHGCFRMTRLKNAADSVVRRFSSLKSRIDSVVRRFSSPKSRIDSVVRGFSSLKSRIDSVGRGFSSLKSRIDSVVRGFSSLKSRIDSVVRGFSSLKSPNQPCSSTGDSLLLRHGLEGGYEQAPRLLDRGDAHGLVGRVRVLDVGAERDHVHVRIGLLNDATL